MKVKLTAKLIENLKSTSGQLICIDEHPQPEGQLCLRIGKKRKTWYIQYFIDANRKKFNLGTFPTLSLAVARLKATELLLDVSKGADPQAEKLAVKSAPTVCDLWEEYQKTLERKIQKKAPATLNQEQRRWVPLQRTAPSHQY